MYSKSLAIWAILALLARIQWVLLYRGIDPSVVGCKCRIPSVAGFTPLTVLALQTALELQFIGHLLQCIPPACLTTFPAHPINPLCSLNSKQRERNNKLGVIF